MKEAVLGFDTSNYRTSVAAVTPDGEMLLDLRQLLPVEQGKRGLRQSDALYLHLKQLAGMSERIRTELKGVRIVCAAASVAPRGRPESYMPVFEAGSTMGKLTAAFLNIPFVPTDHQRGHIRAAIMGTPLEMKAGFMALHLSGGTTDLLAVRGNEISELGGSADLHAGQLVDRIGVALGLSFPAGPEMELLAEKGSAGALIGCSMERNDLICHFSGAETKAIGWIQSDIMSRENIAREIYDLLARTIARMLTAGKKETGIREALLCGGVASSDLFRRILLERLDRNRAGIHVFFGDPVFCGDNAAGVALIGADNIRENAVG